MRCLSSAETCVQEETINTKYTHGYARTNEGDETSTFTGDGASLSSDTSRKKYIVQQFDSVKIECTKAEPTDVEIDEIIHGFNAKLEERMKKVIGQCVCREVRQRCSCCIYFCLFVCGLVVVLLKLRSTNPNTKRDTLACFVKLKLRVSDIHAFIESPGEFPHPDHAPSRSQSIVSPKSNGHNFGDFVTRGFVSLEG